MAVAAKKASDLAELLKTTRKDLAALRGKYQVANLRHSMGAERLDMHRAFNELWVRCPKGWGGECEYDYFTEHAVFARLVPGEE